MKAAPGVIDCLTEGFSLVTRFLWVVLFPIALDAVLYFAPRITAQPVVEQFLATYSQAIAAAGNTSSVFGGTDLQMVETIGQSVGQMNLLGLLSWNPVGAVVPSFVAGLSSSAGETLTVATAGNFLALVLGVQLVGLLLGSLYLGLIGQLVRDGRPSLGRLLGRVGRYWLTFLAFIGLLLAAVLLLSLVIAVLSLVSLSLAEFLSAALTTAAFFVGLLLAIYLYFLTAAVVVGERGPLDAARSSFRVVQGNFWSSIFLIALTFVIGQGMLVIWDRLADGSWGVLLAVVGSAFVTSGLTAASMYFYWGRARGAVAPSARDAGREDASS